METRSRRRAGDGRELEIPSWVDGEAAGGTPAASPSTGRDGAPLPRRAVRPGARRRPAGRGQQSKPSTRSAPAKAAPGPGHGERIWLLTITYCLLAYGLVMAYSASIAMAYFDEQPTYYWLERQAVFAVLGVVAMLVLSRVDYVWWQRAALPTYLVALGALVFVLIPGVGSVSNGARRWIVVNGFTFQPSELAKLAAITMIAWLVVQKPDELKSGEGFARMMLVCVAPAAFLIMLEPDLGTTLVLTLSVIAVVVAAGARVRHLVALTAFGLLAVGAAILIEPYRMARITAFIDPWQDPQGTGFQTTQSLISVASGRLTGVGLGNSVQKFGFLPEQTTDMITGIIGEELGLVGMLVLIALYVALACVVFRIALMCRETYGKLLAVGIGSAITVQATINIGAALAVLPLTGVPLPLVSCGGSSLVVVLAGIGIVANIASNRRSYIVVSPHRRTRAGGGRGDRRTPDAGARSR